MITTKKLLFTLMALLTIGVSVQAESGTCGTNLTWVYDNGTLTISGTGEMDDFKFSSRPWGSHQYNDIKTVIIDEGVTSIGSYAFSPCYDLASVTIPSTVKRIGQYAFERCWHLTSVVLPEQLELLEENAFKSSGLKNVTIPANVAQIGNYAFASCGALTSVTIQDGVQVIGGYAFSNCEQLTTIDIPQSVTELGAMSFFRCYGLSSITIPEGVKYIRSGAFEECKQLAEINIPKNVEIIASGNAFLRCQALHTINVDNDNGHYISVDGVLFNKDKTEIVAYPMGKTATSYAIPEGVTTIGDYAFAASNKLTDIAIPNGVTTIKYMAFFGTGLTHVTFPNSVTTIGPAIMSSCSHLQSVVMSSGVTSFAAYPFSGCDNLQYLDFSAIAKKDLITSGERGGKGIFDGVPASALIYLPVANATNVTGTNIVNSADGENFTCERYEVADGKGITIPYAFTATAIDNTRLLMQGTDAYTLCLPYALTSDANIQFFELGSASEGTLTFTEVDATEPLKPYLAVAITAESEGSKLLASTASDVAVSATTAFDGGATVIGNYTLEGTLQPVSNASAAAMQAYILQEGNRWGKVTESNAMANIPAQRAFITSTVPSPAMETIFGGTTGVRQLRTIGHDGTETYYDLNGRRIGSIQAKKGVVIVNGKKVIF